ncbi:MAG: N-acetyl-gamma-glutamyl-phosphate reductase [Planctomycetota bacterium]|nr:N-acetyl-gamma-glutamyl-phosphate reductase [Planctomycetota bacterium]
MKKVAVFGASGYGGLEALRLLLSHPQVEVIQATSRDPGRRVDAVHPGLRGMTDLVLTESVPEKLNADLDVVFLALPHGKSGPLMDRIIDRCKNAKIIDLAQDFRVGFDEEGWVYGFPEVFKEQIAQSQKIACPGCFATSIALATLPALKSGRIPTHIIVDAKTGSSGSGTVAKPLTHHPIRVSTMKAYKVFSHQHEREVKAAWQKVLGPDKDIPHLSFVPQSSPLVRGIYSCVYLVYGDESDRDLPTVYKEFYRDSPFVRVHDQAPNVASIRGTNNADIFVQNNGAVTLVIAAIDNLVRGAAGQAVQCMNLSFGWPENTGLRLAALIP